MQNINENNPFSSWLFNVQDRFKGMEKESINNILQNERLPCSILMTQIIGDFNFGAIIRSSNAFNIENVFYYGKRKYDKRSTVGTHHYTNVVYLDSIDSIIELKKEHTFVALENNIEYPCQNVIDFDWKITKSPIIVIGEEGCGIPIEILSICDYYLTIPIRGSVRSFNAANAAGIALYDFYSKHSK